MANTVDLAEGGAQNWVMSLDSQKAMIQIIHATFSDGAFRPDEDPHLPANSRVRLTIEPVEVAAEAQADALRELEELWNTEEIQPGPPPLSRDQLHDRD